jgi:superfamily II DNA or RNA helicase
MIILRKINETYIRVIDASASQKKEIHDAFSFIDPIAKKNPNRKNKFWNCKISLFESKECKFPIGLMPKLVAFLKKSKYEYKIEGTFNAQEFSEKEALDFIKTLKLPLKYQVRDYQLQYFIKCVRNQRAIVLSPTSSGKSLTIYLLFRYFDMKTLLIVPTIALVNQMYNDFKDYGYDVEKNIHCITAGEEKITDKKLVISTWQSLQYEEIFFFQPYRIVFGDECHGAKANVLKRIMNMMTSTLVRIGFTGTLHNVELYDNQIEGLFGPVVSYISTKQMIERGFSTPLTIKSIILEHDDSPWKDDFLITPAYQIEKDWILNNQKRNKFIANLSLNLKGNTFVMFNNISHGKAIYNLILEKSKIPVYFIDGSTSGNEREILRNTIQGCKNSISVVSKVFTTGVNIPAINNIIFAYPSKSRIQTLQSIGRGLRLSNDKFKIVVFDLVDDLLINGVENYSLRHYEERKKMYKSECFPFSEKIVNF